MKSKITIFTIALLVIVSTSCKKWLDISSKSEITSEQQFSDITGFRDAVIGVYTKLAKPELYSKEMTWRTVEFLSQNYAVVASAPDLNVPRYLWNTAPLPERREMIWAGAYSAIANINQILEFHEKNRAVFERTPITDSLIKGEMLALRAFLHFDMMRLYGKGNLGTRSNIMQENTIPYVTEFTRIAKEQRSNKKTLELLKKDISEAIIYLEADPLSKLRASSAYYSSELASGFISTTSTGTSTPNRKMRMNYWAAKALYARILLWEGTPESKAEALKQSLEVIGNSALSNGLGEGDGAYYTWTALSELDKAQWPLNNTAFVNEQLFTLSVEKLLSIQTISGGSSASWFNATNPNAQYSVIFLTDDRKKLIFEYPSTIFASDYRANQGLRGMGSTSTNFSITKLYNVAFTAAVGSTPETPATPATLNNRIPLIRVTELFYIAAECLLEPGANYDKVKAVALLNKVRNQRNITSAYNLSAGALTDEQIKEEITKEYMKEFIGEGQLFFYYKRLGFQEIPGYAQDMTDIEYQMPMPESEMINGGVRTN